MSRATSPFLKIFAFLLFVGVICSFAFPFYESSTDGMTGESFMIEGLRKDEEGYWTTFNGFGSLFAYFNALLSAILLCVILAGNDSYLIPRTVLWLHLGSHLLVLMGNCVAGTMLSPPDNLLQGYALLSVCVAALLACAFVAAQQQRNSRKVS